MKHSMAPAVIIGVRLSRRLQRVARLLTVGLLGGLAFLAARHGAPPPHTPPHERTVASDRSMAEAWLLAENAQGLLQARRPAAALTGFQHAYALSGDPTLLLEVARLENEVGSPARAAHAFELFLERGAERLPQQRQLALRQLKALGAHTARVNMQTNVHGAEVEVEAERGVAKSNGFVVNLLLDIGERRINLSKPGYETQTVSLDLQPGEVRTLRVDLDKAARGRSQAAPAKPRWAQLDSDAAASESRRGLVEDVRAAL
jgi:hypothetical protein